MIYRVKIRLYIGMKIASIYRNGNIFIFVCNYLAMHEATCSYSFATYPCMKPFTMTWKQLLRKILISSSSNRILKSKGKNRSWRQNTWICILESSKVGLKIKSEWRINLIVAHSAELVLVLIAPNYKLNYKVINHE